MKVPLFIILLMMSIPLFAQEPPAWVSLGKGMEAYRNNELGEAMRHFQTARKSRSVFPEADYAIGLVYDAELNFALATRYYTAAINTARDIDIQEEIYPMYYKLARIQWLLRDNVSFERNLNAVIEDDELFSSTDDWFRRNATLTFMNNGVDNLLFLYRREQSFSFIAHRELGIYYTIAGRDTAIEHMVMACIQVFSPLIRALIQHQPLYEFTTVEDLLTEAQQYPELRHYIIQSDLYRILYFLGQASYSYNPQSSPAINIWRFLSEWEDAGRWSSRAASSIVNPDNFYIVDFSPNFP